MSTITKSRFDSLVAQLGSQLHEGWREEYHAGNLKKNLPADAPRWKDTSDQDWVEENKEQPYFRMENGMPQVNIDIDFAFLPSDKRESNERAATVALAAVLAIQVESDEDIERICAEFVHPAWTGRDMESAVKEKTPYCLAEGMHVRFDQLSEANKEKDRLQVRLALKVIG